MTWLDDLADPEELRRCVRDLMTLSTLPAVWTGLLPQEICESAAAALLSMLETDLIFVVLPAFAGAAAVEVVQTRYGAGAGISKELRNALARWLDGKHRAGDRVANPFGPGMMAVIANPLGFGLNGLVLAGSSRAGFPSHSQRWLLNVASDPIAIALHRWRYEGSQRRYQSLLERSSDFIGIADLDGTVRYINPAGLSMVGLVGMDQAEGLSFMAFVHEMDKETTRRIAWPQVLREGRWSGEIRMAHFATGEAIPLAVEWFIVDDPRTGRPMSMATVSRDLRPERLAEQQLRALNETLEQRLRVGSADLARINRRLKAEISEHRRADVRLREVQLELFHSSRLSAAGQMAAALAHELSQPLSAATNSLGAVRRLLDCNAETDTAMAIEAVGRTLDQVTQAGEIVQQLRNFVRHGKARRRLENIRSIIEDAITLAGIGTEALGIAITIEQPETVSLVYADRIQLQQVMVNMLRNAMEAVAESVYRAIRVSVAQDADGTIKIAIADSGPGLPREIREHLFEPFVTTKSHGMGLGLSISRSIVDAHGGVLTVAPNDGGGTVFSFTLEPRPVVPS